MSTALEAIAIAALVVGAVVLVLFLLGFGNDDDADDVRRDR
jgi:multisubunit Na+/H+ antiporter MnhB subunit